MVKPVSVIFACVLLGVSSWAVEDTSTVYIIDTSNNLYSFPLPSAAAVAANEGLTVSTPIAITNITAGETLVGIDVRPQTQRLYGLGVNATANTATLYHISPETGFAAVVGTAGSIALTDGTNPIDFPDPATVQWDIDFNPAADRLRIVAGSLNFRVNPNTGTAVDGDNTGLTSGNVTGTNPDGSVNGGTTTVGAAAYTNNQPNNGNITTLYTLDEASNSLFIQNPPNVGTQVLTAAVTLNANPLDFVTNGFDIVPGVNVASSNAAVTSGVGYACLTVGLGTALYRINLVTAVATKLADLGPVRCFAIRPEVGNAVALNSAGDSLLRFNPNTPGTVTTQALATGSLASGETLVGIDFRPQTGQFYGLAINHTNDTGTLYLVDPQTGGLTAVGTQNQIAFTTNGVTVVDFPDPATAGYGIDFNPTVDRLRITTSTGLNFRVNPNTGAGVDGDNTGLTTGTVTGTNPDGSANGSGSTGVSGAAYTRSFAQSLTGGTTTLYTLDATQNMLFIQNPANAGTQTLGKALTLGGSALDITALNGFDIPASVDTNPDAMMAATIGGVTSMFRLNLSNGVATGLGAIGAGTTQVSGLTVFTTAAIAVESPVGTILVDNDDKIDFGSVAFGSSGTKTVTLRNTGSQLLNYSFASTVPTITTFTNGTGSIAPGGTASIQITYTPDAPGTTLEDIVTITNSDAAAPQFDIDLDGFSPAVTPIVTAPTSANVAATTATLGGNITDGGGSAITEIGVVYALTSVNADPVIGGAGVTKVVGTGTAVGVFTTAVTGLAGGSAYTFKAYATNGAGTGYSSAAAFTTITFNSTPNTPTGVIDVNSVFTVSVSNPNATVTWNFGDGTAPVTGASVTHLFTVPGTYTVTVTATDPVTGATVTNSFSIVVSDLAVGQTATLPGTQPIVVKKATINVGKTATFDGTIPINTAIAAGQTLTVSINGFLKTFTLDKRGSARTKTETVSLKADKKNPSTGIFKITLKGSENAALLKQGVTLDASGRPKKVLIQLTFNGQTSSFITTLDYGKSKTTAKIK